MRRGYSLITLVLLTSAILAFWVTIGMQVESSRYRVSDYKYQLCAKAMACSGLRYARAMLAGHRWVTDRGFDSPEMSSGSFTVQVHKTGKEWAIHAIGKAGWRTFEIREVASPP